MKKKLWIIIIVLILCVGFFVYKENVKKEENNTNVEENIITGTNINKDNSRENKTNEIKELIENNNIQNELVEEIGNIAGEQNSTNTKETNKVQANNSNTTKHNDNKIKETLAPSGFMGSSLLRVVLYDNGEVYLIRYNGEGYEEKNIENKELLAINAFGIKTKGSGEDFEAIVIKGSSNFKIKNKNYSWIEFEN